jgi:hypothetical protein
MTLNWQADKVRQGRLFHPPPRGEVDRLRYPRERRDRGGHVRTARMTLVQNDGGPLIEGSGGESSSKRTSTIRANP